MFLVDTNLLVYAAIRETPQHSEARSLIETWRQGTEPWFLTWPIVYEFIRVTTHQRVFSRPLKIAEAWAFIESLSAAPAFDMLSATKRHMHILRELIGDYPHIAGNVIHDFHTVALMKEHGITEIRTADTDFFQFKFLRVVNPLGA